MAFFVTGFGPFANVDKNPTQELIALLEDTIGVAAVNGGQGPAYHVLGTAVLEVSAKPARDWLQNLYSSRLAAAAATLPVDAPIVVLHLGVDAKGDHLKLEQRAANEASFRVPDQAGWQPDHQLIDDHPGCRLDTHLHTDLSVHALAERLRARQYNVHSSLDAGRFVCNWVYYLSLLHSQKQRQRQRRRIHALFLHVPPVTAIPLRRTFQFLLELLQAIAEELQPADGNGGGAATAAAAGSAVPAAGKTGCPAAAEEEPAVTPVLPVAAAVAAAAATRWHTQPGTLVDDGLAGKERQAALPTTATGALPAAPLVASATTAAASWRSSGS